MRASERLQKQLSFIVEVDKLKDVLRRTSPIGLQRRENAAEHSWHVVLAALMLHEHSNQEADLLRVMQMLAIHDVVEVDVGDTFHYSKSSRENLAELEAQAAQRIFGLLPEDQASLFVSLWEEFEARKTPEAKFAAAVDRFIAFVLNKHNAGGTWVEHRISAEQIIEVNRHVEGGSRPLWDALEMIVEEAVADGLIEARAASSP